MKIRVLVLAAILGGALAPRARATTLVRLSLQQLTEASSAIVRGRVVSQQSRWNPQHTRIVTFTTLALAETMKGTPGSTVVVEQLGGTVGNIRVHVSGTVHFHPATDYVLFLEPAGSDTSKFILVGMIQGAYRVYRDAATLQERVIPPVGGFSMGSSSPAANPAVPTGDTVPLGAFWREVAGAAAAPIAVPRGTSIPLIVQSAEPQGVGRVRIVARTATTLFPNTATVIPAGSEMVGTAELASGVWRIRWTELSVRGTRTDIRARSEEPRGRLEGRALVVEVR